MIQIEKQAEDTYTVTVDEGGSSSSHTVTIDETYYEKLTGGKVSKEELIKKSFEFLLQRESKESILSSFNLKVISNYFPEYERQIPKQI
jgi:hypothetical protein